jgi:hypothetical protein
VAMPRKSKKWAFEARKSMFGVIFIFFMKVVYVYHFGSRIKVTLDELYIGA